MNVNNKTKKQDNINQDQSVDLRVMEKRVKKLTTRLWAGLFILFVMLAFGILLFAGGYYKQLALALTGNYTMTSGDLLTAGDWNTLADDFVNKSGDTISGDLTVNGVIIGKHDCRTVEGDAGNISFAQCENNEFLLTGGGRCNTPTEQLCPDTNTASGFIHLSKPDIINNRWITNCYKYDFSGESCSQAYAICCKK